MIFNNPVHGTIHLSSWKRPSGNVDFEMTQDFGPTSLSVEPSFSWSGGEGIAPAFYSHFHKGIDLGNGRCGAAVVAAHAGTVKVAGTQPDGAIAVIIDHGNGWTTGYWHLHDHVVAVGVKVAAGALIGHVGDTGHSTACHLHFYVNHFGSANHGWLDPWRRLAQNVTVHPRAAGVNIRSSAGSGTTVGALFATTKDDGTIRRTSDNANLGSFAVARTWGGTVHGASYTVSGVAGNTWEKMWLDGLWRYLASPLAALSAQ